MIGDGHGREFPPFARPCPSFQVEEVRALSKHKHKHGRQAAAHVRQAKKKKNNQRG